MGISRRSVLGCIQAGNRRLRPVARHHRIFMRDIQLFGGIVSLESLNLPDEPSLAIQTFSAGLSLGAILFADAVPLAQSV